MATTQAIIKCLARLNANAQNKKTDEDLLLLHVDWQRLLVNFPDDLVETVTETFLLASPFFPTVNEFMEELQDQRRVNAWRESGPPVRSLPGPETTVANAHVGAKAIRLAAQLNMGPARDWAEIASRSAIVTEPDRMAETRGHDHHGGRENCDLCSRHDHSSPDWRSTCPKCGVPDLNALAAYDWSPCRTCDGNGFLVLDETTLTVRPCETCNGHTYTLWLGGHMEPGHRCDECAPTRRSRRSTTEES